jgi:hypothetical protein
VGPFSGDFLIALNNLPAAILLCISAGELALYLGASRTFGHLAALAAIANVVVFRQLLDAENDVAVAGLFLACLCYGLRYARRPGAADLLLGGVCLGLFVGTKLSAMAYAGIVGLIVVLLVVWTQGWRPAVKVAAAWAAGAVLWGGYWYTRNALATGNPFYPLGIKPETNTLARAIPGVWQTSFAGSARPEVFRLVVDALWRMAGPCHVVAFLGVPVSFVWLVVSGLRLRRHGETAANGLARLALGSVLVATGILLVVTPLAVGDKAGSLDQLKWGWTPVRYGLPFFTLAVIALAVVLHDVSRGVRHLSATPSGAASRRGSSTQAAMAGRAGGTIGWAVRHTPQLLLGGMAVWQLYRVCITGGNWLSVQAIDSCLIAFQLVMLGLSICQAMDTWPGLRSRIRMGLCVAGTVVALLCCGGLSHRWHDGFAEYYDEEFYTHIFSYLRQADPDPPCIGLVNIDVPYPFFGSERQFKVRRLGDPAAYARFVQSLRNNQVGVVVARYDQQDVDRFAEHPQVFLQIAEGRNLAAYQVRLGAADEERAGARSTTAAAPSPGDPPPTVGKRPGRRGPQWAVRWPWARRTPAAGPGPSTDGTDCD